MSPLDQNLDPMSGLSRSKLLILKVLLNDTKPLLIVNHNKSPFLAFVFKL